MDKVKSLNGLIKALKKATPDEYVKIAKNMHIPLQDFEKYNHWQDKSYSRNCILKTEEFELILICWKKGAITSIHGHDNQRCWIYQVDGEMNETRYSEDDKGNLTTSNRLKITTGKLCYMQDSMGYHKLENLTEFNSITLHLYAKPVSKCAVYNAKEEIFEERILTFDSIEGVLTNA